MHFILLPDHTYKQSYTEHDDNEIRNDLMGDGLPHVEFIDVVQAEVDADHIGIEEVFARREEIDDGVKDKTVEKKQRQWQVMDQKAAPSRSDPSIVKDQNVPFNGGPGK